MKVPTGHALHWAVPACGAIVPGAHGAQSRPSSAANPLGQGVQTAAFAGDTVPGAHWEQVADALALANVPAAHGMQVADEFASVASDAVPAKHSSHAALPAPAYVPAPQTLHVDAKVAPTVAEARPAGQRVQLELPVSDA